MKPEITAESLTAFSSVDREKRMAKAAIMAVDAYIERNSIRFDYWRARRRGDKETASVLRMEKRLASRRLANAVQAFKKARCA